MINKTFDLDLKLFNMIFQEIPKGIIAIREKNYGEFDSNLFELNKTCQLEYYFQSWKYFQSQYLTLHRLFIFYPHIQDKTIDYMNEFNSSIMIIHLRLDSDFRLDKNRQMANPTFFKRAINLTLTEFSDIQFIIVSDVKVPSDLLDILLSYNSNIIESPRGDPDFQLCLMSKAVGVIIGMPSSTFVWWGAWLNQGLVIYPKFDSSRKMYPTGLNRNDFFLPTWVEV